VRSRDRIAEVLGEARGQRVIVKSIHRGGVEQRSSVKRLNLLPLEDQMLQVAPPQRQGLNHRASASRRCHEAAQSPGDTASALTNSTCP
jgi:hypothetical protein